MSERRALARAIHKAGTTDPDSLAEYLIREGWGKREAAFTQGVQSAVTAVNSIQVSSLRPLVQGGLIDQSINVHRIGGMLNA